MSLGVIYLGARRNEMSAHMNAPTRNQNLRRPNHRIRTAVAFQMGGGNFSFIYCVQVSQNVQMSQLDIHRILLGEPI